MSLTKRLIKGSPLTFQEGDDNLDYLEAIGRGQELLEEADALARADFSSTYAIPANADLQAGVFKSTFQIPDIFSTILFGNPNDVNNWNNGAVLQTGEGVFIGNKILATDPSGDSIQVIGGYSLPVQNDLPVFGNVDIFTSDELVANNTVNSILKSGFLDIKYEYQDLGSGEYSHDFYIQFGAFTTVMVEIEGDANTLSNVDLRFL